METAYGQGRRVVIVVDMLRGFLEPGCPLDCGEAARAIVPVVRQRIEEEMARGATILWVADNHAPDDKEFAIFPPHCIRGTAEAEIIPALADLVDPANLLPKTRYSGFYGTDLDARLAWLQPEIITVVGVCTDICVLHTVADARNRDYAVVVPADCVATFDPTAHHFALDHLRRVLGATVSGGVASSK
ncbi:MAG: cysteine hydrolase family protein [Thermomicrobiales bacterium]